MGLGVADTGGQPSGTLTEPGYRPEPQSVLGHAMDIVSRPGYSTVGATYEALRSYQETGQINWQRAYEGFREGLAGKQYMTTHILHALDVDRDLEQHMSKQKADMLMAGIGFVGDVVMDWSNLIGVGAVRAAVRGTAAPVTAKAAGLLAGSRTFTGLARLFNASFGFPQGYHDLKFFARHALDAELTEVLKVTEDLARHIPDVKERTKIFEQLAKPGLPPAEWDDMAKATFGELRTRLQDIGQKWVDGGWMHPNALKDAMSEGFEPRYYMIWDRKSKKWFVDEKGPHGIPGSLFDKGAKPGAQYRRLFPDAATAREYFEKQGITVVDDITKTPKDIEFGIHIGKDPIFGYALRASEQARFMAGQHFVDNVLNTFGTKITNPGEILEGLSLGSMAYKVKKAGADVGFYLPKGALRFYSNTMVDNKKLQRLLRTFGAEVRSAKEGQLPRIMAIATQQMKKQGFSDGEIVMLREWLQDTKGAGAELIIKDIEAMREVVARMGAAAEGPLIALDDFEKMAAGLGKRMVGVSKNVPVYSLPKEIAQDLNKLRFIETDEGARLLRGAFDKSLNLWKGYATVVNPGFHFRNTYSNWFNMFLADVNPVKMPQRLRQAWHVQWGGAGKLSDTLSYEQIAEEVKRLGVRGKGWAAADIAHSFKNDVQVALRGGKPHAFERLNPASGEFELIRKGRKFGTFVEDNARIALYIDRRLKGATAKDAALAVRKYLFDYNELSKVERDLFKKVWPFYTWMRKNIPLQFEHLVTKPYKYSAIAKGIRGIGYVDPETEIERSARPDYFDDLEAFKTPLQNAFKGVPGLEKFFESDNPLYFNPNFPFQDLNRVEMRDLIASLNPLIKIGVELGPTLVGRPGWEAFSRRPLYRYPGERDPLPPGLAWLNDLPDPVKDVIGVGPTLSLTEGREVAGMDARYLHVLKSLNPFFMNMARAVPEVGPSQAPARYEDRRRFHILSWLLGIKLMPLDVAKGQLIKMIKAKDELGKIKSYLRYESPSSGKVHDLLQEWTTENFPEAQNRLEKAAELRRKRQDLLDQASR